MKFLFEAKIYKVGINPCVKVPSSITDKLTVVKGYIPVRGKIKGHPFQQTLIPVKNAEYRLYVNGPMLKGAHIQIGDIVKFAIEQDLMPRILDNYPVPEEFAKALNENNLFPAFKKLTPSRQKEILAYLGFLKTKEALIRNIHKVISSLKDSSVRNTD